MVTSNSFLNAGGADWTQLVSVAVDFGVGYLTKKSIDKSTKETLEKMANLDAKQAEKLKKLISESVTEVAKTQVIFEFLEAEKEKELVAERKKKRIIPLIGLGIGVVLISLVFYKLHEQNG